MGFRIENPNLSIAVNLTEALTNIPVARLVNKANNLEEAITGNHETWQRVALGLGWSKYSLEIEGEIGKAQGIPQNYNKAIKYTKAVNAGDFSGGSFSGSSPDFSGGGFD